VGKAEAAVLMGGVMPGVEFEVQGHRGARGLAPENTLVGFEIALDAGVSSIETDVHLTGDDVAVLFHDARIAAPLCSLRPGHQSPPVEARPLLRRLTLNQVRGYRIEGPAAGPTPLAERFAAARGIDPCGIPTLAELFAFVADYGNEPAKTKEQQDRARHLVFDIELKRVPFNPETIGDGFNGTDPATLERQVVAAIRSAGVLERSRVRSFDHRCVFAIKRLEQELATGLLICNTRPTVVAQMLFDAWAHFYCPDYHFLDGAVVREVIAAGKRVIPYTVNDPADWERLIGFGVHGITTDVPDLLLRWLRDQRSA
jgi:glycerophosphoryl diester phosphodiesterase